MGTNCAPLVADLFLFCYERDFMKPLSRKNQADIIEAFNSTLRYLDDLLNIDNIYFDQMVDRIYPSCESALNPPVVCSTDRSKAVVPVLVLLFVALWFILRGDLLYVFPCVILFLCFSVLLVLRLPRLGKRELILVFFVRLFGLCLFRFFGFLFLLGSGKGCGLWLWHSLDFSLIFFVIVALPGLFSYLFLHTTPVVFVPCGDPRKSPRTFI